MSRPEVGDGSGGLSVRQLTRHFDGRAAVDGVSFDVRRGELVALLGASGSGKTTTLRIVAGYEVPDRGSVTLDGKEITRLPPARRGFGMVFQHYALFPHMSVAENVTFGLEARGVPTRERLQRTERVLESVGLQGKGSRRVQQLSGGEQQRVALARAVVVEPSVLLLDEPLSNLDPSLRQSTRDELRAMLRRVGAPALFVTHDQEDAFAVADRIVLLASGRVLQIGTPEEVYARPASREVASFVGHATLVPARDDGETATISIGGIERTHAVLRPTGSPARLAAAVVVLRPEALAITEEGERGAWPGRVVGRRFAGAVTVYHVRLSDEVTVEIALHESALRARVEDGAPVSVSIVTPAVPIVAA